MRQTVTRSVAGGTSGIRPEPQLHRSFPIGGLPAALIRDGRGAPQ